MTIETTPPSELCPTCGSRLSEGSTKCLVCGTELGKSKSQSNKPPKAVQGSRMPEITLSLPAAMGFLALFLGIGAILVYFAVRQQPEIAVPATATLTPTITATSSPTPTPVTPTPTYTPEPTSTPLSYQVVQGDTCISIAFAFDVSVQSIVLLNSLPASCNTLFVGQNLLIPQPTATPTPMPSATLSPEQATREACEKVNYKVQDNDTLSTIASNYGVPMDSIRQWNGLVGDTVRSGQNLIIPLCEQYVIGDTPTPTVPPPYAAPNLLLPADGAAFTLADASITLQWATVGALRENEAYQVIIEDVTDGEGRRLIEYVTDTKFTIPNSFRPSSNIPHVIRWWVATVRQAGTNEEGLPTYDRAGAISDPRVFTWAGISAESTPSP